jgi:chorismate dehydratase
VLKLRISIVQYLNTAPLVRAFTHGPLQGKYELSFTVPSQCAEALRGGSADIAIIPAIEVQRIDGLVVLPGLAIASKNKVRSLLMVAKKSIQGVKTMALDQGSRSTQALARILCAGHWGIAPAFFEAPPDAAAMLEKADAALLIGDPALRLAIAMEPSAVPHASGGLVCRGRNAGVAAIETLYVYDLVEEWHRMSGLPAVLALWAARTGVVTPEVFADFSASRDYGVARIAEISRAASSEMGLPASALESYLTTNVDYSLDAENRRGLEHYYQRAAACGLIPQVKPIDWAFDGGALATAPASG